MVAVVLAALFALAAGPHPASGQSSSDPWKRRKELQRERARRAAEIDVLRASDQDLERALDALDADVQSRESSAARARQAAEAAAAAAAEAREAERRTAAELRRLEDEMRRFAVQAYVGGSSQDPFVALKGASSLDQLVVRQQLANVVAGQKADVVDRLRAAREDLADLRAAAEHNEGQARARRREAEGALQDVEAARESKRNVADDVESRLERALAEAASVEALDRQLAAEIARRQAALARRITRDVRRPAGGGAGRRVRDVRLVRVRGIEVAAEIADNLEGLLASAERDGLSLGGSGYRSPDGQAATRRANCGSSDYDVYEKPASQCRPPTARPGQSMHEQGLAVDFTSSGRLITSRGDPAFRWLSANAGRFGFHNLPSEPWHWSTNGN